MEKEARGGGIPRRTDTRREGRKEGRKEGRYRLDIYI